MLHDVNKWLRRATPDLVSAREVVSVSRCVTGWPHFPGPSFVMETRSCELLAFAGLHRKLHIVGECVANSLDNFQSDCDRGLCSCEVALVVQTRSEWL